MDKDEVVKTWGAWSAHNIRLGDGLYTIDERQNYDHFKLARIKQIVFDPIGILKPGSNHCACSACMRPLMAGPP